MYSMLHIFDIKMSALYNKYFVVNDIMAKTFSVLKREVTVCVVFNELFLNTFI